MVRLDNFFSIFFDRFLFSGDFNLFSSWISFDREQFINWIKKIYLFCAYYFLFTYFFVDQFKEDSGWLFYRMISSSCCLLMIIVYSLDRVKKIWNYKIPAVLFGIAFAVSHTVFFFKINGSIDLYYSVLNVYIALFICNLCFGGGIFLVVSVFLFEWMLIDSMNMLPILLNKAVLGIFMAAIIAFIHRKNILNFKERDLKIKAELVTRKREQENREILKAIFPDVISERLFHEIDQKGLPIHQSLSKVLRPQKKEIVCIYSDIRSYTQNSKGIENYAIEHVIPNMRLLANVVEEFRGVPRKIGDLLLAYFDSDFDEINLLRSILCSCKLIESNLDYNKKIKNQDDEYFNSQIKRYVLIAKGEATVGNVGGYDSSIEITVLGTPINFLSRLDDVTKHPKFVSKLSSTDIILCASSANMLNQLGFETFEINLKKLDIIIRDFNEVEFIYFLPFSHDVMQRLEEAYQKLCEEKANLFQDYYRDFVS